MTLVLHDGVNTLWDGVGRAIGRWPRGARGWGMTQDLREGAYSDEDETLLRAVPVVEPPDDPGDTSGLVIDLRSGEPIIQLDGFTPVSGGLLEAPRWAQTAKRAVDILGAVVALIVLSPVLLLTSLAVVATSRGPVFFAQERVGVNGESFKMLKFRSMYRDAEARREQLASMNVHATGPIFKIPNDPRITPVGRLIRRLSIDELPQLFNVLGGSMTLVGPRPPLPAEVRTYNQWQAQRLLVRPGITCIWQVSGRSQIDFDTWVEMDLEYIESWSLGLDLVLMARTIPAVLSMRGAY